MALFDVAHSKSRDGIEPEEQSLKYIHNVN
jgi:hypothetical protein